MKGISPIVSSVYGIAILLVILGIVSLGLSQYYSRVSSSTQLTEAETLSQNVATQILSMYNANKESSTSPTSGENITLSQITIEIPPKLGGSDYEISLTPRGEYWAQLEVQSFGDEVEEISTDREYASVKITTEGSNPVSFSVPMNNIPIRTEGSSTRQTTITVSYVRINSGGTISDKIVLS